MSEKPLFKNEVRLYWTGFMFELILLLNIMVLWLIALPHLQTFSYGSGQAEAEPSDIAMVGFLGLYGFRISTFVAMIRRNRRPQVIEWWCTLIGLAMLIAWPLDGTLLRLYASLHGYEFCRELPGGKVTHDLFVLHGHPCPG